MSPFCGVNWYPCFGLLVTSALGFKVKEDPSLANVKLYLFIWIGTVLHKIYILLLHLKSGTLKEKSHRTPLLPAINIFACLNLLSFSATDLLLSKFKLSQDKESGHAVVSAEWPPDGVSVQPAQWGSLTVCCVQMTFTQLIDVHIIRQAVLIIGKVFFPNLRVVGVLYSTMCRWSEMAATLSIIIFVLETILKCYGLFPNILLQTFFSAGSGLRGRNISRFVSQHGGSSERNVAIWKTKHPHKLLTHSSRAPMN